VSPYLCDVLRTGDGLELRGPIGGYFVWDFMQRGPLFLAAGGSGIVPLMAMLRHRARASAEVRAHVPVRLLYTARTWDDINYRDELLRFKDDTGVRIAFTLTRSAPTGWNGYHRRVDSAMLQEQIWPAAEVPNTFVCGPTPFVESVANLLVELGHDAARVRTERFGPTG